MIDSIKIDIYSREHLPPHFHVLYAGQEILLVIKTLATYIGSLPLKQHRIVLEWAKEPGVKIFLMDNFLKLNPDLRR